MKLPALLACTALFAALGSATPASAAPSAGGLGVAPAKGTDQSVIEVETTGPCPAGDNLQVTIFGRGFPAQGQPVVSNSPTAAYERNASGGYSVPLAMTLRDFVNLQPDPVPLGGQYRLSLICRDNVKVGALAEFAGSLTFSTPRAYQAAAPIVPLKPFAPATGTGSTGAAGTRAGAPAPVDAGGAGPDVPALAKAAIAEDDARVAADESTSSSVPGGSSLLLVLAGAVAAGGIGIAAGFRPKRRAEQKGV